MKNALTLLAVSGLAAALASPNGLFAQRSYPTSGTIHSDSMYRPHSSAYSHSFSYGSGYSWNVRYAWRPPYPRPGSGYRWDFSIGIGLGWPYWAPYLYAIVSAPPLFYPYYYTIPRLLPRAPCPYVQERNGDAPNPEGGPGKRGKHLPGSSAVPDPVSPPNTNPIITAGLASSAIVPRPTKREIVFISSDTPALQGGQLLLAVSPDLENAIEHLRNMPPFARQREIDRGRYSNLSPAEKHILRSVAGGP
jgi:hypothetical protein